MDATNIFRLCRLRAWLALGSERFPVTLSNKSGRDITPEKRPFDFGDVGLQPVCTRWGFSRGHPIDRYYIEDFLARHRTDIRGHVIEIGDNTYTRQFGGTEVSRSDVLDIEPRSPLVTIVADLTDAPKVPSNTFDCVIITQVLVLIQDVAKALATLCRILKPGGVALITVPGISQISSSSAEAQDWSWSFYPKTLRWLLLQHDFDEEKLLVGGAGNLKTTVGFLLGLAQEDLLASDFAVKDERYPLVVTARAVKKFPYAGVRAQGKGVSVQ